MTVKTKNERETTRLATRFAKTLRGGEVIGLIGDLGSGKTTFVRGLARVFGITGVIRSPTFTLMHIYPTKNLKLKIKSSKLRYFIHIDAYRLRSARELAGIGIEEYLGRQDTVTAIEWADRVRPLLTRSPKTITIHCSHGKKPEERRFSVERRKYGHSRGTTQRT